MPGWKGNTRQFRRPGNWFSEIQPAILRRDSYRCRYVREDTGRPCLARASQVDHVVPNDDHSPSNLRAICGWHHQRKSSQEGGIASGKARRAKKQAAAPIHPGLSATPMRDQRDDPAPF